MAFQDPSRSSAEDSRGSSGADAGMKWSGISRHEAECGPAPHLTAWRTLRQTSTLPSNEAPLWGFEQCGGGRGRWSMIRRSLSLRAAAVVLLGVAAAAAHAHGRKGDPEVVIEW